MNDDCRNEIPLRIEEVLAGIDELQTVLGPAGCEVVPAAEAELRQAIGARDRGDPLRALEHVARAMRLLAAAAERLDSVEALAMRTLLDRFGAALQRRDRGDAQRLAEIMLEHSGARRRKDLK